MDLDPTTTAVLTMEMQRGICGDLAAFAALRDELESTGAGLAAGALCTAARAAGARVVHCTFSMRPDRIGTRLDVPLMSAARRDPGYLAAGTPVCELLPELGHDPSDIISDRCHGMTPFSGTELDSLLRSLGIRTVVAAGVSLNVGVFGLSLEAFNLGYDVVVATDAVAGVPHEYGQAVLQNSMRGFTRQATTAEIVAALHGG